MQLLPWLENQTFFIQFSLFSIALLFNQCLMVEGKSLCVIVEQIIPPTYFSIIFEWKYNSDFEQMKKSMEEWKSWGKRKEIELYFYKGSVLDLTTFAKVHPGGKKALKNYVYKDITHLLFTIYHHKREILQTLNKYVIGSILGADLQKQNGLSPIKNNNAAKQKKKVCFRNTIFYSQQIKQNKVPNHLIHQGENQKCAAKIEGSDHQLQLDKKNSNNSNNSIKINSVNSISGSWVLDEAKQECSHDEDIEEVEDCLIGIKIPCLPIKTMSSISL